MHEFLLVVSHDGSQLEFRGAELARVRGEARLADPYTYVLGAPEVVVYRTTHGQVIITCDDVLPSPVPAGGVPPEPREDELRHRSAMYAESIRPRDITEQWLMNAASQWGIPSALLSSACAECR